MKVQKGDRFYETVSEAGPNIKRRMKRARNVAHSFAGDKVETNLAALMWLKIHTFVSKNLHRGYWTCHTETTCLYDVKQGKLTGVWTSDAFNPKQRDSFAARSLLRLCD